MSEFIKEIKVIIKEHRWIVIFSLLFLFLGMPMIIHTLYKIPAILDCLEYEVPAGDLLTYCGTVLTFIMGFMLSAVIFIRDKRQYEQGLLRDNKISACVIDGVEMSTFFNKNDFFLDFPIEILSSTIPDTIEASLITINIPVSSRENHKYEELTNISCVPVKSKTNIELRLTCLGVNENVKEYMTSCKSPLTDNIQFRIDLDFLNDVVISHFCLHCCLPVNNVVRDGTGIVYKMQNCIVYNEAPRLKESE